jgi:hypothetical protein
MPGWVPTVESEILILSLSTPPLAITSPTKIMSRQSSKTSKASSRHSIGMFSPGEARYVSGQAWDQSRIDAANTAAQNWVSDYRGMKSLMFFKAFNSLLKWNE